MTEGRAITLLGVFVAVLVLIVAATAAVALFASGGSPNPDGPPLPGQSPAQFQPSAVSVPADPETGTIGVDGPSGARILVDNHHANAFSMDDLAPMRDALFAAGHEVSVTTGPADYNATLNASDALLIVQPTTPFTEAERERVHAFVADGGRVLVLAEPRHTRVTGSAMFASSQIVSFEATALTGAYGFAIGGETLYNLDDAQNDNNFKSIYAVPDGSGPLVDGVERVTFDRAGHVVLRADGAATSRVTAAEGTRTLESRRSGTYPVVARNESVVFVADSTFIKPLEVYDADNEVFVGNLLRFLVSGSRTPADSPATGIGGAAANETATPAGETTTPAGGA